MAQRIAVLLMVFSNFGNAFAQGDVERVLTSVQDRSYPHQQAKWSLSKLFEGSDLVVIGTFRSSRTAADKGEMPNALEGKDVERLVSEFDIVSTLCSSLGNAEMLRSVAVAHFRFRNTPVMASQPPHFLDFSKIEMKFEKQAYLLFLSNKRGTEYRFTAGDYFASLSVRVLSAADGFTELRLNDPKPQVQDTKPSN